LKAYTTPASRLRRVRDEDAIVRANGNRGSAKRREPGRAVDLGSTHRRGAVRRPHYLFDVLNGPVERRSLDWDTRGPGVHGRDVVVERRVGKDTQTEGLCILGKERLGVPRLGLDDARAPVQPVASRRRIQRVHLVAEMLDLERVQDLALGVVVGCRLRKGVHGRARARMLQPGSSTAVGRHFAKSRARSRGGRCAAKGSGDALLLGDRLIVHAFQEE